MGSPQPWGEGSLTRRKRTLWNRLSNFKLRHHPSPSRLRGRTRVREHRHRRVAMTAWERARRKQWTSSVATPFLRKTRLNRA
jgi:hypothetical protein